MSPEQIVAAARAWIGTPFVHQGRTRYGVDCAGLVICVGKELGELPTDWDVNGYGRQPDGSMFKHCAKMLVPSQIKVGAVAMMQFTEEPQHLGIIAPYRHGGMSIIHALQSSGKVVEHRLDNNWRARIKQCFAFPGMDL